ncbi:MAG: hypothetical protein LUD41_08195 [Phascolarctobacterium sp.]|nr:hypothetical protein [Phascolarctobacterium sp.]
MVENVLSWFERKGTKLVVIACNIITVLGPETLKKGHTFDITGMSLGTHAALSVTENKRIGVMATEFTIKSRAHEKRQRRRMKRRK